MEIEGHRLNINNPNDFEQFALYITNKGRLKIEHIDTKDKEFYQVIHTLTENRSSVQRIFSARKIKYVQKIVFNIETKEFDLSSNWFIINKKGYYRRIENYRAPQSINQNDIYQLILEWNYLP